LVDIIQIQLPFEWNLSLRCDKHPALAHAFGRTITATVMDCLSDIRSV
jgi:hypothetical protein